MTSHAVAIATLAITLTGTNCVVLFTGFLVHRVDIWWPLDGPQNLDIRPVSEINVLSLTSYFLLESSMMLLGNKANSSL